MSNEQYGGNGDYVTRAELNAHLRPLRENIRDIKDDVRAIRDELGAGPRWLGARANAIVDKLLPALLMLGAAWILGEKLSGG